MKLKINLILGTFMCLFSFSTLAEPIPEIVKQYLKIKYALDEKEFPNEVKNFKCVSNFYKTQDKSLSDKVMAIDGNLIYQADDYNTPIILYKTRMSIHDNNHHPLAFLYHAENIHVEGDVSVNHIQINIANVEKTKNKELPYLVTLAPIHHQFLKDSIPRKIEQYYVKENCSYASKHSLFKGYSLMEKIIDRTPFLSR